MQHSNKPTETIFDQHNHPFSIMAWKNDNILLMLDLNSTLLLLEIVKFISANRLQNLIPNTLQRTYRNGSTCIHYVLGTENVKKATVEAGYFPFDTGPFISDPRAFFIDFNEKLLFKGIVKPIYVDPKKSVNSKHTKSKQTFINHLDTLTLNKIENNLNKLKLLQHFTPADHEALEQCDQRFLTILINAGAKCCLPNKVSWNPKIDEIYMIWQYWKITLPWKQRHIHYQNTTETQEHLIAQLPPPPPPCNIPGQCLLYSESTIQSCITQSY